MKLETSNSPERGVALVITLILLSVITFMAIAFLVISRHASEAVTTVTQQAIAKQAAADAVQQAEAGVIASMLAKNEGFDFGPLVSQNYQSAFFDTTLPANQPGVPNVNNVNYLDVNGNPLDYRSQNYLRMLNNQLVLPRPPVVITTNANPGFTNDFRFYLDLNRNGIYDPTTINGQPVFVLNQFNQLETVTAGDPEWIGILEHPDQPHSRSNFYAARYAFFAQPIGNSLDIDYIHNQVKELGPAQDGFLRNQGVGSWEINLAGFLNGLNPNYWTYGNGLTGGGYVGLDTNTPPVGFYSSSPGSAFQDAAAIMQFRYNGSWLNLPSFYSFYSQVPPYSFFPSGPSLIDYYSAGPLMTGEAAPILPVPFTANWFNASWSGGGNVNQFFTSQDFFNAQNSPFLGNFPNRLARAGLNAGLPAFPVGDTNFNRYTYYRMLAQMGMESAPEPETKLNLNYINIGGYGVSNFVPWTDRLIEFPLGSGIHTNAALVFFTNAANRLLGTQTNFIVSLSWGPGPYAIATNLSTGFIPVYPTNFYTPSVHRMLQLAANIYDAANPKVDDGSGNYFDYPSVFRPVFGTRFIGNITNQIFWVRGYVEVTNTGAASLNSILTNTYSLANPADRAKIFSLINSHNDSFNVYEVPWVIGAKKGLPNFNQISLESFSSLTRKLQIVKPGGISSDRTTWHTNVQYVLSISNALMAEAWNSYVAAYPRAVDIGGIDTLGVTLTNEYGVIFPAALNSTNVSFPLQIPLFPNVPAVPSVPALSWQGVGINLSSNIAGSFRFPLLTSTTLLPGDVYSTNSGGPRGSFIYYADPLNAGFETTTGYPLPRFGLILTNQLRFVMVDHGTGRVIDYVQLTGLGGQRDLTGAGELQGNDNWADGGVWDTNREPLGSGSFNSPMNGIENQISISQQMPPVDIAGYSELTMADWQSAIAPGFNNSVRYATTQFNGFFNGTNGGPVMQVPYTPTRNVCVYYTWQANDPLVHYTLPDLTDLIDSTNGIQTNWVTTNIILGELGQINQHYMPWGGSINGGNPDYNTDMSLKDPLVTRSDDWQFPDTNFPGIGWLGRVHRGTPWQTVYMKSLPVDATHWQNWTGNAVLRPSTTLAGLTPDSLSTQPINDWGIFDLFTTAPNDNASRGQLSVNQPNFADWAAVLDGVVVLSNGPASGLVPVVIDPNATNGALYTIYSSITNARNTTVLPGGVTGFRPGDVFTRVGDILSAPALSVASPFLNIADPNAASVLNDEAYERLPQQIMSLLRVGQPRYVIYAYGQSLKPADRSIVSSGPFYGTCTNYQITGEVVTRTVVRFEPVPFDSAADLDPTNLYTPWNPTHNPVMPPMPGLFPQIINPALQPQPPRTQMRAVVESFTVLPPE